jgi:hypothetical protein
MTERVVVTIFIVVTHLVGFEARRVDGLGCVLNLFLDRSLEARYVYGRTGDTELCLGSLETRRVYSSTSGTVL